MTEKKQVRLVLVQKRRALARHRDVPPFSMAQAIENEGTGKSHFPVPFRKRPREGRFRMLTTYLCLGRALFWKSDSHGYRANVDAKGSRKNNFPFSHLIFRPSLPDLQSQNPQKSAAIPAVLLNQIE